MQPTDDRAAASVASNDSAPRKRAYIPPKLERLGTIGELTHGEGANNQFDGSHPPGQNKSII